MYFTPSQLELSPESPTRVMTSRGIDILRFRARIVLMAADVPLDPSHLWSVSHSHRETWAIIQQDSYNTEGFPLLHAVLCSANPILDSSYNVETAVKRSQSR